MFGEDWKMDVMFGIMFLMLILIAICNVAVIYECKSGKTYSRDILNVGCVDDLIQRPAK